MRNGLPLVLSTAAILLVLLGSTPVAGAVKELVLPAGSVGTAQLRAGAVTSAKLHNGSVAAIDLQKGAVTTRHVKDGSLFAADFRAGQLPAGPKGDPGATNVVFRRAQTTLGTAGIATAIAQCGPTEKLTGGGGGLLRAGDTISADPSVDLVASYPATDGPAPADGEAATRWITIARVAEPSSTRLVAFAACAKP
jgi:hypothetical protein